MSEMKNIVILENIRSAYNVGNIIRTADALGWDVWLAGYSPSPEESLKVRKTALGAEESVHIQRFDTPQDALVYAAQNQIFTIAAEITDQAQALDEFQSKRDPNQRLAVVFGNEVDGVEQNTLDEVDKVVYVPMQGIKESMNVGQTTAIFMRALR